MRLAAARLPMSASSARLGGQHGNMSAASVHASLSSGGSKPGTPQKPQSDGHTSSNEAASTEATPLDVSALPKPSSALSHHSIGSNPVASLRTSSAAQGENIRPSSAHRSSTAGRTSLAVVDPAALESAAAAMADMEARFAEKERAYASEVARLRQDVLGKGGEIAALSAQLSHIQSLLLDPRLNALSRIERELHDRLDAVALAEETLESLVRCPGCLGPVVPASESDGKDSGKRRGGKRKLGCGIPVTCVPCGHTYCATCASTFLEASLSGPRCELCAAAAPYQPTPPKGTPRPSVFSNPAYLSLAEHVGSRGNLVKGLGTWVAGLATTIEEVKRLRESLKGKSGSPTSTQLLDECELVSSIPEVTGVELDESAASEASGSQSN
ncbi:hypothetical protein M427DRAFT_170702 [Gonapodya prolifera JEL478]|uniref:RING-type domain-containing protein n=1 Tax=Gonapodya prolifera (strain JEL478) TaxID=1344416 RepID=A0A139B081_GONPJ|nr:hypothetical protein M427DRAFT_170702 [Gonapodya prolifera JEL478]|eukprot:KXS22350.1 hypothetical protein M427DRAFT_170702 [Gonapodya prolifera JEL478]